MSHKVVVSHVCNDGFSVQMTQVMVPEVKWCRGGGEASDKCMGGWQGSILRKGVKHSEFGGDRAINLHVHHIQIIVKPTFEDNRLLLIINMTVFPEEMDFSTMLCEVRD